MEISETINKTNRKTSRQKFGKHIEYLNTINQHELIEIYRPFISIEHTFFSNTHRTLTNTDYTWWSPRKDQINDFI